MTVDVASLTSTYGTTTYGTSTSGTSGTAATKELDRQAFLQLLVAQLRNQDPTSPMDSSQLLTQTTQLTTMERLVELSETSRESFALQMRMAAANLVGQEVTWKDADGVEQRGVVTGVSYDAVVPTVRVGETDLPLDVIASVSTPRAAAPTPDTPAGTDPQPA